MESLQDKTARLREIANNLNLYGESIEMLVQLLGYSLHVSEVEHIAYSQEASLERATQLNSKIQHCVERMYSVNRGTNPRVILNLEATKLFQLNMFDEVMVSNNYKVYYLGYWDEDVDDFQYSGVTIYPENTKVIIGLLASEKVDETWTIGSKNVYYHDILVDNLSSDGYIMMGNSSDNLSYVNWTRNFAEHISKHSFFDLTLPDWGQRIYYPEKYGKEVLSRDQFINKTLRVVSYKYLKLDSLNKNELKNIKVSGASLVEFNRDSSLYKKYIINNQTYSFTGATFINEVSRDTIESIHYLANKNRYTGTLLATNSDLSYLLHEMYPNKVIPEGTTYTYNEDELNLYYIPNGTSLITDREMSKFNEENRSYFITDKVNILTGTKYKVKVVVNLELYKNTSLSDKISEILESYQNKFNLDLGTENNITPAYQELKSLITKISEVKYVSGLSIKYYDTEDNEVDYETVKLNLKTSYYSIAFDINSVLN